MFAPCKALYRTPVRRARWGIVKLGEPVRRLLISAGLLLPLALDTFALAAALGLAGLERRDRLRVALVFTVFEAGMPIAGVLVGRAAGSFIGGWAGYGGIAFLLVAGFLLLRPGQGEDDERRRLRLLARPRPGHHRPRAQHQRRRAHRGLERWAARTLDRADRDLDRDPGIRRRPGRAEVRGQARRRAARAIGTRGRHRSDRGGADPAGAE